MLMNINGSAWVYSKPSQKSRVKPFFSFQKLAQISVNWIKFPKEKSKHMLLLKLFKTENYCKIPQIVDTTDGTQHKTRTEDLNKDAITEDP